VASRYAALAAARVRSLAGSPGLLAMRSLGDAAMVALEVAAPVVLVSRFGSVAGWTGPEVALLIGLARSGEGLAAIFGRSVDPTFFSERVRGGSFDQVLVRPVSPLAWLFTSEVELRFVFRALAGVIVAGIAARLAGVSLTAANIGLLSAASLSAAVLVLCFLVMGAALTFLTLEGSEVANLFANGGLGLVSFPLDLYGSVLRFTFTFLIPMGLCVYVPALVLLGREGPALVGPGLLPLLPVVLVVFVGLTVAAWRAGVRRYQSTGS
jgi:ABC-2 type transport system permease protein